MGEAVSPERVRGMEIFQGLSDEEYEMVAKVCRQETYEEGSVIFNEGEESRKVYIVDSGRVVCESEAAPGKRVIVGSEVKGVYAAGQRWYRHTTTLRQQRLRNGQRLSPLRGDKCKNYATRTLTYAPESWSIWFVSWLEDLRLSDVMLQRCFTIPKDDQKQLVEKRKRLCHSFEGIRFKQGGVQSLLG